MRRPLILKVKAEQCCRACGCKESYRGAELSMESDICNLSIYNPPCLIVEDVPGGGIERIALDPAAWLPPQACLENMLPPPSLFEIGKIAGQLVMIAHAFRAAGRACAIAILQDQCLSGEIPGVDRRGGVAVDRRFIAAVQIDIAVDGAVTILHIEEQT